MKTKIKNNFLWVANLQEYSLPYVSLYVDMDNANLYIFVRITHPLQGSPKYVVKSISVSEVESYMHQKLMLTSIFNEAEYKYAYIDNGKVVIENESHFELTPEMKCSALFDPVYCVDNFRLKVFFKKYNNHQI